MTIYNEVYGEYEVNEEKLIELLNSDVVQRLKHVRQAGANYLINSNRNVTRYEHSEGVMILIKKIGGSLEEQIAGLLHDISHTAFSHTIDMLVKNRNEDYHEIIKKDVVEYFELNEYFRGSEYNLEHILDEKNYPILEQPQPDLCADRIDYTIRDMKKLGAITKAEIDEFLNSLSILDGKIVITNLEWAKWFCIQFHNLVKDIFMDPTENYYSYKFTCILNYALKINCISMDDLIFGTDSSVLNKLRLSHDDKLRELLSDFENKSPVVIDKNNYEIIIRPKARVVNPVVYIEGNIGRLSDYSSLVNKLSDQIKEIAKEGLYLRI